MRRRRLARGDREILVLGDSHVFAFRRMPMLSGLPGEFFFVVPVEGATASGLDNPQSLTQAGAIFEQELAASTAAHAVLNLGEVDTGFVIWYRAQKYGAAVEDMLEQAVSRYQALIARVAQRMPVTLVSAPLPTIRDGQSWGKVANLRSSITATQRERTELTLRFNQRMQGWCQQQGHGYLSLDAASLGPDGCVSSLLLNVDPHDHHYDRKAYRALIHREWGAQRMSAR